MGPFAAESCLDPTAVSSPVHCAKLRAIIIFKQIRQIRIQAFQRAMSVLCSSDSQKLFGHYLVVALAVKRSG